MIPSSLPPSSFHINPTANPSLSPPFTRPRASRCGCRRGGAGAGGPSWGSNAESVRPGRFSFRDGDEGEGNGRFGRRWWSDDTADGLDGLDGDFDETLDDDYDDDDDGLENPWDRIWIFKVLRSYGYLLPAIIASMLLATGPKAFLMALALPLGQSAFSLAIDKLWGNARERSRTKPRTKKQQPFARSATGFRRQQQEKSTAAKKGGQGYQSWVSADAGVSNKGSASSRATFGGWDELDRQGSSYKGSMRRQPPKHSPQAEPMSKSIGKVSKIGRYRDAPLFMRLLIAIFPFLGSWTRIL